MMLQSFGPTPMPSDVIDMALQYLPDTPLLVGVGAVAVGGRMSGRLAARKLARRQAKHDGYALPMFVRDQRNISTFESMGNVMSIPREGSILALGATRSGKTETGKWIVSQMQADENEPMLVYDHKDDYQTFFDEIDREYIKLSAGGSTHTWNIFDEIDRESDADEIARAIFAEVEQASGASGPFSAPQPGRCSRRFSNISSARPTEAVARRRTPIPSRSSKNTVQRTSISASSTIQTVASKGSPR